LFSISPVSGRGKFDVTSPDSTYAKPFLTVPEQIRRLRERGMDCGTDNFATSVLERYGYYRLSGYWHLYRARPTFPAPEFDDDGREIRLDRFVHGTNLAHVVALYDFDHELRTRLSDALSLIEVSLRFFVGHRLGRDDRFSHRKPEVLGAVRESELSSAHDPTTSYVEWLEEYDRHEKRARDSFVLHFRRNYGPHLPIWVATEVMSFGVLSNLYPLMRQVDQEILAARFQISTANGRGDRGAMSNWFNSLRNVRNICAHYGRIWNRTFDVLIDAPGQLRTDPDTHLACLAHESVSNKLYGILVVMRHLLLSIAPQCTDIIEIVDFIEARSRRIRFGLNQLGFPDDWSADPLWSDQFDVDQVAMAVASLLDRVQCLTAVETREVLFNARIAGVDELQTPEQEARAKKAAQRKLLKTYLHYNVVIEIEAGGAKYYPKFQFQGGKIIDALAEINKSLSARCTVDAHPAQVAAALLDWWQTPHPDLTQSEEGLVRSPLDLLGTLSEADFAAEIEAVDATRSFVIPALRV